MLHASIGGRGGYFSDRGASFLSGKGGAPNWGALVLMEVFRKIVGGGWHPPLWETLCVIYIYIYVCVNKI